jgi:hypothetical protein
MISFLRNLILGDFWLKLFSLVLAILIWLLVSFAIHREVAPATEQIFSVPVVVTSAAADVHNFHVNPGEVQVRVRGQERKLETLDTSDVRAVVNLTGADLQRESRQRIQIILPLDVTLVGVVPAEVEVLLPANAK